MNLHLKIYWPWRSNEKGYWIDIKCDNIIQSMKHSSFYFPCVQCVFIYTLCSTSLSLTIQKAVFSPCVHLHSPLRFCSPFRKRPPCAYSAFTMRSPFVQGSLIVKFVFIQFHLELKSERISLCESQKKWEKEARKETYISYQNPHFNQNLIRII